MHTFAFFQIAYEWNHIYGSDLFNLVQHIFIHIMMWIKSSFLLLLSSNLLNECNSLFIYLTIERYLNCFRFWQFWIKLLYTFLYKFLWENTFSFQLTKYLGVGLLGGMGNVYLILWETANSFPGDCTISHSYQQSMSIP